MASSMNWKWAWMKLWIKHIKFIFLPQLDIPVTQFKQYHTLFFVCTRREGEVDGSTVQSHSNKICIV